jgi:Mg-chelatase subunit ChlD
MSRTHRVLFAGLPLLALAMSIGLWLPRAGRAAEGGGCSTAIAQRVAPERIYPGQESNVTITVRADCSSLQLPIHVAFVLDNSLDMGGPRMADMREGVGAFVDSLNFATARMGLATYFNNVDILAELGSDPELLKQQTATFRPRPGSDLTMAVRAGRQMLERGRAVAAGAEFQEVLILLVGSAYDNKKDEVLAETTLAREAGMLVVTIASGDPDLDTLQAMASGPSFFYNVGISSQYPFWFRRIARDLTAVHLTGAQLLDTLPGNIDYVWGSGIPAPRVRAKDLSWLYATWPSEGITVTFAIAPKELGRHPVTAAGEVSITVDRLPPQVAAVPQAYVEVVNVPTATPFPPTATATPSATAPPTATRPPRHAYLPVVLRDFCRPANRRADVVLVIDTSSSMLDGVGGGLIKLDLAQDAASVFVDELALPDDQAGVVAFNHEALVLQDLSGDRGSIQTSLVLLHGRVARGTRVDLGLAAARALLAGPSHHAGSRPVAVLLTDGRSDDDAAALGQAAALRAAGATVYTIGLGTDADGAFLALLAGDARRYFASPDGQDLAAIYRDIARRTGCAGGDTP